MVSSVDPDQLAPSEASLSGSTLFSKENLPNNRTITDIFIVLKVVALTLNIQTDMSGVQFMGYSPTVKIQI